jgi:hypothetical protein
MSLANPMLSLSYFNDVRVVHLEPVTVGGHALLASATVQLFGRIYTLLYGGNKCTVNSRNFRSMNN